ncbi:hypothetical protein LJR267_002700 [Paraburkholderia hospita]|uniref:hypothetical protein n=1 Tax=Paraburkholderia hospita TaxID=169430 RepID=UPI003ECDF306
MKTIVFLDRATLSADLPDFQFPHRWVEYPSTTPEHVVERCRDAHIVVTNNVPLSGDVLEQLPRLELIGVPAAGVNHLDTETPWRAPKFPRGWALQTPPPDDHRLSCC